MTRKELFLLAKLLLKFKEEYGAETADELVATIDKKTGFWRKKMKEELTIMEIMDPSEDYKNKI